MKFGTGRRPQRGLERAFVESCEARLLFAAAQTFVVTNANDAGAGSLRVAIAAANANLNNAGEHDTIQINIAGSDRTVEVGSATAGAALPAITDPVNLGPADPSAIGPVIELNGATAAANADGLVLTASASFSQISGVAVNRFSRDGIVIQGDNTGVSGFVHVGTDLAGTATNLGNARHGILIQGSNNLVGNAKVVYNGGDGIAVEGAATSNIISLNTAGSAVHSNGGQAIDVGANGITLNDPGDADGGPNASQNYPVLSSVSFSGNTVTVAGTINTTAGASVTLDFFASPLARREGWVPLLGQQDGLSPVVTADANGNASFSVTLVPADPAATLSASDYITAVATAFDTNTFELNSSEFSAPVGGPRPWLAPGSVATWDAEAGALTVTGAATIIADPGADSPVITANGSAAVLSIAPAPGTTVNIDGLLLSNSASASVAATGAERVLVVNDGAQFSLDATSTLDLNDNALVVRNASQSAATAEHTAVNDLVRTAFNSFAWDGPGITSTTAKNDVAAGAPATLGILLNNDGSGNPLFYGTGTGNPTFLGTTVDANTVMVRFTQLGDGDLSGDVDTVDFALFQAGYSGAAPFVGFAFGDYDYNGVVDTVDFGLFQAGYGA